MTEGESHNNYPYSETIRPEIIDADVQVREEKAEEESLAQFVEEDQTTNFNDATQAEAIANQFLADKESSPTQQGDTQVSNSRILNFFGMKDYGELRSEIGIATKESAKIAIPILLSNVSYALVSNTDIAYVGMLGVDEQAACSMANAITASFSFLGFGLASALDTLISNAYGHRNYTLIGLLLQRAIVILTVACVPLCLLYGTSYPLMLAMGYDQHMAFLTLMFCVLLIPGTFAQAYFRILTSYLNSMGQVVPVMLVSISVVLLNVLLNHAFIFWLGLGYIGAPIATSVVRTLSVVFLVIWIKLGRLDGKTWTGIHVKHALDFAGIKQFLKLGIPGSLATWTEVMAFNVSVILAGVLGSTAAAAHNAVLSLTFLTFTIPLGISVAACIQVGQKLGANRPKQAKFAAIMTICVAILCSASNATFLGALSPWLPMLYSKDETVRSMMSQALVIAAGFQLFDGLQGCAGGVLRSMGRQKLTAIANGIGYYVIGLPLGAALCFLLGMGINGLWLGLLIGLLFVSVILNAAIIFKVDWHQEAHMAVKRTTEKGDTDEPQPVEQEPATDDPLPTSPSN